MPVENRAKPCRATHVSLSMIEGLFQPMHLLLVAIVAMVVFGPKRLPELGKGLGEAIRGFKDAFHEQERENKGEIAAPVAPPRVEP